MDHQILPNGNLKITANLQNPEDIDDLSSVETIEEVIGSYFHEKLHVIPPERIGALTSAPIVSDELLFIEDEMYPGDKLWWFPDYQIVDPMERLRENGEVIFLKV